MLKQNILLIFLMDPIPKHKVSFLFTVAVQKALRPAANIKKGLLFLLVEKARLFTSHIISKENIGTLTLLLM